MNLSPQAICTLECLIQKGHTSRELMIEVGCNNPADVIQHLRKDNFINIKCDLILSASPKMRQTVIGVF